jgi:hypothetical protein
MSYYEIAIQLADESDAVSGTTEASPIRQDGISACG